MSDRVFTSQGTAIEKSTGVTNSVPAPNFPLSMRPPWRRLGLTLVFMTAAAIVFAAMQIVIPYQREIRITKNIRAAAR